MKNKFFILLTAVFCVALILGAGCTKDKTQDKNTQEDVVSADDDTSMAGEVDVTSDDDSAVVEDEWKIYKSEKLGISFSYPADWHVLEHENMGILLSDKEFPSPLPPELYDTPVVIGISDESEEDFWSSIQEIDANATYNQINDSTWQYEYISSPHRGKTDFWRKKEGNQFLEFSSTIAVDDGIVGKLINTLSFQ